MISVIVPHLNQPEALKRCLASLVGQAGHAGPAEIIVVDNGSKASPADICAAFPDIKLMFQPIPGPGPARNLGASIAAGDILAFIDADCWADATWLSRIESRFAEAADVPLLGGDVRIEYANPHRPTLLEAYENVFAFRMKEYIDKEGYTGTGNLAVRRTVFAAVGPFGGIDIAEDRDWGRRALLLGYRTHYCPEMIVYHPARKSLRELAQKWQRQTAHDFEDMRLKPGWWPRWLMRSAAVALSPAAELARIGFTNRLEGWRARWLAFLGVIVIRTYRSGLMLALAFGADPTQLSSRWNRGPG